MANRLSKLDTSRAVALAVSVNSPGGLPVQSDIIANKIRDFATKRNLKVYNVTIKYVCKTQSVIQCWFYEM